MQDKVVQACRKGAVIGVENVLSRLTNISLTSQVLLVMSMNCIFRIVEQPRLLQWGHYAALISDFFLTEAILQSWHGA